MMSIWHRGLSLSLFGESHGRGVGLTVHGLREPATLLGGDYDEYLE